MFFVCVVWLARVSAINVTQTCGAGGSVGSEAAAAAAATPAATAKPSGSKLERGQLLLGRVKGVRVMLLQVRCDLSRDV